MFNKQKPTVLLILILSSLSLLALTFNPQLQKSYFSITPNSPFSYEFPQTNNGAIIAHYFDSYGPAGSDSKYVLFNLTSGDAYPLPSQTVSACQIVSPIFQHIHYHYNTDNLVYYCAQNSSLLFLNQADYTVETAISLNLSQPLPIAKLTTYGMMVRILAMDTLFNENPQNSVLITVAMQDKQVYSQIVFNQSLAAGEAVVAFDTNYLATNIWQNNSLITQIYLFNSGSTHPLFRVANFTSATQTITKLFIVGNYIVVTLDATVLFLNNMGILMELANIQTKELTAGVFHPAVVLSTDGDSLYLHTEALEVVKYTNFDSTISKKNLGTSQDMQIALASLNTNDLIFTYDPLKLFFNIWDLETMKNIRTTILSYNDLILTDTTYTVVTNTTFSIFNLTTDIFIKKVSIPPSKYYYNKDQHIVTFLQAPLNSSCEVTHLDLTSGKSWSTLKLAANLCPSDVSFARMNEQGNPEVVIPGNQSFLIVSETYGQLVFNTSHPTHDTDSINVNFDDLSLYYYTANQVLKQINASYYTFNSQSKSFQLNSTKLLKLELVENQGFFTLNQNLTMALSESTLTLINRLNSQLFIIYANHFNLVTSFDDQSGTPHIFFSYVSDNSLYPLNSSPAIYSSSGVAVSIPGRRGSTMSGQATGPRSFALYDEIYTSVGVVRFFNSDPQASKTVISI